MPRTTTPSEGLYTPGSTFKRDGHGRPPGPPDLARLTYVRRHGQVQHPQLRGPPQRGVQFSPSPGRRAHGYSGEVDPLPLALTESSDYYFYNLGYQFWNDYTNIPHYRYGETPIQDVASAYGLTAPTPGVDLPGESSSIVDSPKVVARDSHAQYPNLYPNQYLVHGQQRGDGVRPGRARCSRRSRSPTPTRRSRTAGTALDARGGRRGRLRRTGRVVQFLYGPKKAGPRVLSLPPSVRDPILQGLLVRRQQSSAARPTGAFHTYANFNLQRLPDRRQDGHGVEPRGPRAQLVVRGVRARTPPPLSGAGVIAQGGYGADAAAPLVRNIFDYLATNPISSTVTTPTPSSPPSLAAPALTPRWGRRPRPRLCPARRWRRPPRPAPPRCRAAEHRRRRNVGANMETIWPQLERLLPQVTKPRATSAARRASSPPTTSPRASCGGCSATPTPTRSAYPTRPSDPLLHPERARRRRLRALLCPVGRPGGGAARGGPPPVLAGDHPSGRGVRRPRLHLPAELTYTTVLDCLDLARRPAPRRRSRRAPTRSSSGAGLRLQPRAARRLPRRLRARRRRGAGERAPRRGRRVEGDGRAEPRPPRSCSARSRGIAGVYVPRLFTPALRGRPLTAMDAASTRRARPTRERPVADLADCRYRRTPLVPLNRDDPRPAHRRDPPRLHPRLPVLPGGHDHPARSASDRRTRSSSLAATGSRAPATTRSRSRHSRRPISRASRMRWGTRGRARATTSALAPLPSLRVDAFTRAWPRIHQVRHTGFTVAPEVVTERMRSGHQQGQQGGEPPLNAVSVHLRSPGWDSVKFYFMIGLPTERDEDVRAIVQLAAKALRPGPQASAER